MDDITIRSWLYHVLMFLGKLALILVAAFACSVVICNLIWGAP
jgi:hypothetical protein